MSFSQFRLPLLQTTIALAVGSSGLGSTGERAVAQLVPDTTLGAQSSSVVTVGTVDQIHGGAQIGANLFHSFREFNVATGRSVSFTDPGVSNILARVTGTNASVIDGTVGVAGNANLFLLNPNGILFGPNARLDVRGSFVATTANAIQFGSLGTFSAATPEVSPLLTINPTAFLFNQIVAGSQIRNQGVLAVPTDRSLLLVGGNLSLEGGTLAAPGGRIDLAGLVAPGSIGLSVNDRDLRLANLGGAAGATIALSQAAGVKTSGAGGGSIQLQGGQITLAEASQVAAETLGDQAGEGITVQAQQLVLQDGSALSTSSQGAGAGGNLTVHADTILAQGVSPANAPSGLFSEVLGSGRGGNITVNTRQLTVQAGGSLSTAIEGSGQGGTLVVNALDSVTVQGRSPLGGFESNLNARVFGPGNGGDITVNTPQLWLRDGGQISASIFDVGNGGNITVNATSVNLLDPVPKSRTGLYAQNSGTGNAGSLTVNTQDLLIRQGSWISTLNGGTGRGGEIVVNATGAVQILGTDLKGIAAGGQPSLILTDTIGSGNAGNLTLKAGSLTIADGAQVSASTFDTGAGGSLNVTANSILLSGKSADGTLASGLFAASGIEGVPFDSSGPGGNLTVQAQRIVVDQGAQIAVSGLQTGNAGNLSVTAGLLWLNHGSSITAATTSGEGGNLNLQAQVVLLRNQSLISATAGGTGNGGNIAIQAPFVLGVLSENSDIIANAVQGRGGNITIATDGIYGLRFSPRLTPLSDITASSEFGVSGVVQILSPEIDPSRDTVVLPTTIVNVEGLVDTSCRAIARGSRSEFVVTGRGGLPPSPTDTLNGTTVLADLGSLAPGEASGLRRARDNQPAPLASRGRPNPEGPIVEAQNWIVDPQGQISLVAQEPTTEAGFSALPATCASIP